MWWFRLILALAVLVLGPAGCGFKPLYGRGDAKTSLVADELAAIQVLGIQDRLGQQMRNRLVQILNPRGEPAAGRYTLEVILSQSMSGLAESSDGKATVGRMDISAIYRLTDGQTGKVVHAGRTRSMGSYRYLGPRYASMVSERDSEESVVGNIADDIRTALSAWFLERRPDTAQPFLRAP
jgi:Predicted secreted (periplasmic) protein